METKTAISANELFRQVVGYPNYVISNLGRIKTMPRKIRYVHAVTGEEHFRLSTEQYLKQYDSKFGYKFVQLRDGGIPKNQPIHRLVAKAFIENPNGYKVVNHKNGIKTDNRVENLEWCTDQYNHKHATEKGLVAYGERTASSKLNTICVKAIRRLSNMGWSDSKIANLFDISRGNVNQIKNNKTWNRVNH